MELQVPSTSRPPAPGEIVLSDVDRPERVREKVSGAVPLATLKQVAERVVQVGSAVETGHWEGASIAQIGWIRSVDFRAGTLTVGLSGLGPSCPNCLRKHLEVRQVLEGDEKLKMLGVKKVQIRPAFEPPWDPNRDIELQLAALWREAAGSDLRVIVQ